METHTIHLPARHYRELEKIISALVTQYDPHYIICFGCVEVSRSSASCFTGVNEQRSSVYFLLMITSETYRMEHQVQDYVTSHFPESNVSLAVHGLESVTQAIHQGSRFYSAVCQYGMQLYSKTGLRLDIAYHQMNPATTLAKGSKNYHHRYGLALGFWDAAGSSYEAQNYAICMFLLHQTVEHACKALIKLFTAYRCEMHNLSRLLDLCLIFSDKLSDALPRKTDEDKRLFALLRNSYSEARYKDDYKVSESDADTLLTRVKDVLDTTELLGLARITEYEQKAAEATAEIIVQADINTQMPYAG